MTFKNGPSIAGNIIDKTTYYNGINAFEADPSFINARYLFIVCRELKMDIPESVLVAITEKFRIDYDNFIIERRKKLNILDDKVMLKNLALSCVIERNKNQEEAYVLYKETIKSCEIINENISFHAFRIKAERRLKDEFNYYNEFALKDSRLCITNLSFTELIELYLKHVGDGSFPKCHFEVANFKEFIGQFIGMQE